MQTPSSDELLGALLGGAPANLNQKTSRTEINHTSRSLYKKLVSS